MVQFIPVNEPVLNGREKEYLQACIDSGWISSEGPFVGEFESALAARLNRSYGVAVTSGTSALDAAIASLNIGPGDEVIVPTFTIISCLNQIVRCGATPVLVDADPDTWTMEVGRLESLITPRTRAILIVHIYGLPVDISPVLEVAESRGLFVIEDAAEALGQAYRGRPCGSFGHLSTLSFYPNKTITTGEGGMVLTDDEELAHRLRSVRNLCFQDKKRFVHEELGWNFRMTNVQAALGLAQLERIDEFLERKHDIGKRYHESLVDVPGLQLPVRVTQYAENGYWVFGIVLDESFGDAESARAELAEHGIGSRPFFCPMHMQPVFRRMGLFRGESYPNAERLYRQGLYLPSGIGLTEVDQVRVCDAIRRLVAPN